MENEEKKPNITNILSFASNTNFWVVRAEGGKFYDDFIGNVYDKLYKGVKANRNTPRNKWIEFIETNEILDSLEESVSMMEIGED